KRSPSGTGPSAMPETVSARAELRMNSSSYPKCAAASATLTRPRPARYGTNAMRKVSLSRATRGVVRSAMTLREVLEAFDHSIAKGAGCRNNDVGVHRDEFIGEDCEIGPVHVK